MNEIWKDIEGYEGLYQVSNMGKVRRLKSGRILKPSMNNKGYFGVPLSKEGKVNRFLVHRLVAQAFITNPEGLPIINHRDENPSNNQADNLEWCTYKYNSNYGTGSERMVHTKISNGNADSELCGIRKRSMKEYQRLYQQKNREQIQEYQREYYQKNREQIREQNKERYQKNREQILECQHKNRERKLEYNNMYYQKNRDQINERKREQYHRRRQKIKKTA